MNLYESGVIVFFGHNRAWNDIAFSLYQGRTPLAARPAFHVYRSTIASGKFLPPTGITFILSFKKGCHFHGISEKLIIYDNSKYIFSQLRGAYAERKVFIGSTECLVEYKRFRNHKLPEFCFKLTKFLVNLDS